MSNRSMVNKGENLYVLKHLSDLTEAVSERVDGYIQEGDLGTGSAMALAKMLKASGAVYSIESHEKLHLVFYAENTRDPGLAMCIYHRDSLIEYVCTERFKEVHSAKRFFRRANGTNYGNIGSLQKLKIDFDDFARFLYPCKKTLAELIQQAIDDTNEFFRALEKKV